MDYFDDMSTFVSTNSCHRCNLDNEEDDKYKIEKDVIAMSSLMNDIMPTEGKIYITTIPTEKHHELVVTRIDKEHLMINVDGDYLRITGEQDSYHYSNLIYIGGLDIEKIETKLELGILYIDIIEKVKDEIKVEWK